MLPPEPEILDARLPFPTAQAALFGTVESSTNTRYECGWYGSAFHPDRGCYAVVADSGPLAHLVGDRLRLRSFHRSHHVREVLVYCFGAADIPYDIAITRRSFAALELLAAETANVIIEVLTG